MPIAGDGGACGWPSALVAVLAIQDGQVCSTLINRTGGLRLGGAGRQPRPDSPVTIAATGELMLLSCLRRKGGSLLFGLSPVPGKRHPFTNNCSACLVFGSHLQNLSDSG